MTLQQALGLWFARLRLQVQRRGIELSTKIGVWFSLEPRSADIEIWPFYMDVGRFRFERVVTWQLRRALEWEREPLIAGPSVCQADSEYSFDRASSTRGRKHDQIGARAADC